MFFVFQDRMYLMDRVIKRSFLKLSQTHFAIITDWIKSIELVPFITLHNTHLMFSEDSLFMIISQNKKWLRIVATVSHKVFKCHTILFQKVKQTTISKS